MFEFILGICLGLLHSNSSYDSSHLIANAIREQNRIKEKELLIQQKQRERTEWLDNLKQSTDEDLLRLLENTNEYCETKICLSSGRGCSILYELEHGKELNEKYIDIKNECLIRNLIKL